MIPPTKSDLIVLIVLFCMILPTNPVLSAGILPIKAVVNCDVHVVQAVAG